MKPSDKLIEMLENEGYKTLFINLAQGVYRRRTYDCAKWDCHAKKQNGGNVLYHLYSYNTVTDCVRYGFTIDVDTVGINAHLSLSVNAKQKGK